MKYFVVMPAAGSGRRFSADVPKQYAALAGSTVIEHALAPFESDPDCAAVVVAVAANDATWPAIAARRPRPVQTAAGGAERAHSVHSGLIALGAYARDALGAPVRDDDWIMVHDAARPCLAARDLAALKAELATHEVGGLLAVPLADTLKQASNAQEVQSTIDRAGLWRAATPQVFRFAVLLRALEMAIAAQRSPTDEAQAVEWGGHRPKLVAGRADNIKVTTTDDLALAAAILSQRASREKV